MKNNYNDYDIFTKTTPENSYGLVLSGGAARGIAHIGVYKALVEKKINIDAFAGSSVGGLIASLIACGFPIETLINRLKVVDRALRLKNNSNPIFKSIIGTNLVRKVAVKLVGDLNIEDLSKPLYICASDVLRFRPFVINSGPLKEAIYATTAMPGLTFPKIIKGKILIDGGIVNNLPGDILKNNFPGKLITVYTSPNKQKLNLKEVFSKDDINGKNHQLKNDKDISKPNLGKLFVRYIFTNSFMKKEKMKKISTLHLEPPIDDHDMFDYQSVDELVDAGYYYSIEKINKLNIV